MYWWSAPAERPFVLAPDGTWVASADRTIVEVYDPTDGEPIWQAEVTDRWEPAVMLPAPDGSWLAVADDGLTLHDPRTGAVRWRDPTMRVGALVPDPTGAVVIGTVEDFDHGRDIHVWDATSGRRSHTWYTTEGVADGPDLVVAPDGAWAVTRCDIPGHYGGIWLYDLVTGDVRAEFDSDDRDRHLSIAGIAPDGSWLALRGELDASVVVWHPAGDRTVVLVEPQNDGSGRVPAPPVHAIAPDGRWLVVGSAHVHDAATGQVVHRLAGAGAVTAAVFGSDGSWLATVDGDDDSVSVWDAATGGRIRRIGHAGPPTVAAVAGHLAVADGAELTVWNPHTGHATLHELAGHTETGRTRFIRGLPGDRLAVMGERGVHLVSG